MVEHDDEAIHRLRASDPATGSHPDLHRLRALIAQKAPGSQGADRATAVDDELLRGGRVRTPWIAAAAVAALGLGAGGYALGLQQGDTVPPTAGGAEHRAGPASPGTDPGSEDIGRAEPGMPVEEGSDEDPVMTGQSEASVGGGSAAAMGGDAATSGPAYDPGPVRLTAGEGLPASPGTAEVRVLQSDKTPQEFIDAYAAATGFEGEPLPDGEHFFGSGHNAAGLLDTDDGLVVTANDDGGALHFSYEDIFGNEYCAQMYEGVPDSDMATMQEDWARSYGPDMPFPGPESCREITGERPSDDEAVEVARDFFAQAGVAVDDYTFSAYSDEQSRSVMIDAQPTPGSGTGDQMLSATVGPDGVVSAYGSVGQLVSLGDYPVISAAEAVERFGVREFAMEYGVSIAEDTVLMSEEDWEDVEMPEWDLPERQVLQPGDKIPMLLKDKLVTGAELVRGSMWTQTGGSVEVPVWKLTTGDGMYYPVLALAEEALDFQTWE